MQGQSGRNTTGRPRGRSTVERLPASVREAVDAAIAEGASIDEITALIRENGGQLLAFGRGPLRQAQPRPEPPTGRDRPALSSPGGRRPKRAARTRNPLIQLVPSHPGESRQKFYLSVPLGAAREPIRFPQSRGRAPGRRNRAWTVETSIGSEGATMGRGQATAITVPVRALRRDRLSHPIHAAQSAACHNAYACVLY